MGLLNELTRVRYRSVRGAELYMGDIHVCLFSVGLRYFHKVQGQGLRELGLRAGSRVLSLRAIKAIAEQSTKTTT